MAVETGLINSSNGKGWEGATELQPLEPDQTNQITELDVLETMLQLLKDNPELTGYLITGIDKKELKRNA